MAQRCSSSVNDQVAVDGYDLVLLIQDCFYLSILLPIVFRIYEISLETVSSQLSVESDTQSPA
jgi:hypothetical protein